MRVATLVAVLLSARPAEAADDQFTYSLDAHSKRWPSQPAYGAVSWDQAKCMLRNRKIAFVGDSNTRFHFFTFNVFLDSGLLRSGPYRKDGEAPPDYDHATRKRTWTDWKARSPRSDHRSHFTKSFDSLGTTSDFYFAQTTWFGDDVTRSKNMADLAKDLKGYDLVVFNSGWWDLKPWNETKRGYVACGDDWTAACATSYARDVDSVIKQLLKPAKAGIWREASCCADNPRWRGNLENMNEIARKKVSKAKLDLVQTYFMYGVDQLDTATVGDHTHAKPGYYHRWTMGVLQAAERRLKTGCLAKPRERHVLEGSWVRDDSLEPGWDRYLFAYLPNFHEYETNRDFKCRMDESYKYAWRPNGTAAAPKLLSRDGLCKAFQGFSGLMLGDSLSRQVAETWRMRRVAPKFGDAPGGSEMWDRIREDEGHHRPLRDVRPEGPSLEKVDKRDVCDGGETFQFLGDQRPYSLLEDSFVASDRRVVACESNFYDKNGHTDIRPTREDELYEWVVEASTTSRRPVFFNTYNDVVGRNIYDMFECYRGYVDDEAEAKKLATRDVFAWWQRELDELAAALRRAAIRGWREKRIDVRVWYRTSPPGAEAWIRYGHSGHKGRATPGFHQDPEGYPKGEPWFNEPGGAIAPLSAAEVLNPPKGSEWEYGHEHLVEFNRFSAEIFQKHGHGVLNDTLMLGMRADAHPASSAFSHGQGDAVHYCLPGPVSYLLDAMIGLVRDEYETPRWYGLA